MEDRRIKKTKRALKNTLIEMMTELPFEQISITALCDRAEISRITFYSHYNDKYALVDDIFQDMIRKGNELYQKHQAENNPEHDLVQNYRNVLYAIVELYYTEYAFFSQTIPGKSPYLAFSFYNYVLKTVESYTTKEGIKQKLKLKYSPKNCRISLLRSGRVHQRKPCRDRFRQRDHGRSFRTADRSSDFGCVVGALDITAFSLSLPTRTFLHSPAGYPICLR